MDGRADTLVKWTDPVSPLRYCPDWRNAFRLLAWWRRGRRTTSITASYRPTHGPGPNPCSFVDLPPAAPTRLLSPAGRCAGNEIRGLRPGTRRFDISDDRRGQPGLADGEFVRDNRSLASHQLMVCRNMPPRMVATRSTAAGKWAADIVVTESWIRAANRGLPSETGHAGGKRILTIGSE
ncbi:hypothetical protein ACW2Q0_25615 [Nocardia sp. R16R-3T]